MLEAAGSAADASLADRILMQRVKPQPTPGCLVRWGEEVWTGPTVCELGVYSTYLGDGQGAPLVDECAGWLLRVKADGTDEGGVASGYACLGAPALAD